MTAPRDEAPRHRSARGKQARTVRLGRLRSALTPTRMAAALILALILLVTVTADMWGLPDPIAQNIANKLQPLGSPGHPLGTDQFGRDQLSRLIFGARIELAVALGATAIAATVGTIFGLVGGFYGSWAERFTMRSADAVLAFPPIVLALLVVTIHGPGVPTLMITMGALFAPAYARLAYGQVVSIRDAEFVEASQVFGASKYRTLLSVVMPNVAAPIIAQMPLTLAAAILLESGLSFLGLGVVPPAPSLGSMIADGQRFMVANPEQVVLPAGMIVVTVLVFGLLGDALRDWLDPLRSTAKVR